MISLISCQGCTRRSAANKCFVMTGTGKHLSCFSVSSRRQLVNVIGPWFHGDATEALEHALERTHTVGLRELVNSAFAPIQEFQVCRA